MILSSKPTHSGSGTIHSHVFSSSLETDVFQRLVHISVLYAKISYYIEQLEKRISSIPWGRLSQVTCDTGLSTDPDGFINLQTQYRLFKDQVQATSQKALNLEDTDTKSRALVLDEL